MAHAQVQIPPAADPGVIQNRELEREQRQRLEEQRQERIEQPVRPSAPVNVPAPVADLTPFEVRQIQFAPASEILSVEELEALAAKYRGPAQTLSRLHELVEQINALYRSKGVVTSQASLPSQDVTEGLVRILLTEGRVGHISVQGNASTREAYVTERVTLRPGSLVDLATLENDLLRFNRSNDAQLRVELKPGTVLGQTDIGLTVVEPKVDDLRLFGDNAGSNATGVARLGTAYTRHSLSGRRDDLYLSVVGSEGNTGSSVTYSLPVNLQGTRLNLGYFDDTTKIVSGPTSALNITGQAIAWSVSVRHPLRVSTSLQLDGLATWKQRKTGNWIDSVQLTAAELQSNVLGVDAQLLDSSGYWSITAEVASGVNRPDGANSREFTVERGSVRRRHTFDSDLALNGSLNWQYADLTLLPSSEQFQLGGEGSVRGFEPGVFSGDQGFVVNLELQRQLHLSPDSEWTATGMAFVDYGETQAYHPANSSRGADKLTSFGVGMSWTWRQLVQARLSIGIPLSPPLNVSDAARAQFQLLWQIP